MTGVEEMPCASTDRPIIAGVAEGKHRSVLGRRPAVQCEREQ
jgi:hypothetical protein